MLESLEHMQYISTIYKDPYCICELYSQEDHMYRVFKISNETVRKNMIAMLMNNHLSFGTYGERLYIMVPYVKGVNLLQWKQEHHKMLERITLCKQLVFQFIAVSYDEELLALCLDANTLAIAKDNIDFFDHPNFSLYLRARKKESLPQRMAQLCYEILEEDSSIHKQNYLRNPKEFQMFSHKLIWKRYRTFDHIMMDLHVLEEAYQTSITKKKVRWKYGVIAAACMVILFLLLFGFLEWREQNAQTYEGIQNIGNEQLSP